MDINNKLRLITEGYTMEEINSDPSKFSAMLAESEMMLFGQDDIYTMLESANTDLEFISESAEMYIQESVLEGLSEKIKKFFAWISKKIESILKWIKERFTKKSKDAETVAEKVEKKVKSGEIKEKIDAIKSKDAGKYKAAKQKHEKEPDASKEEEIPKEEPKAEEPAEASIPEPKVLKTHTYQNIFDGSVPDVLPIVKNICSIINTSLKNMEVFNSALVKGTSNAQLANRETIGTLLISLSTQNKFNTREAIRTHMLGAYKEFELAEQTVANVSKVLTQIDSSRKDSFELYQDLKNSMDKLKDESEAIINKYKDSGDVRPDVLTKRVNQMIMLATVAVSLVNNIIQNQANVLVECENILKKLDSL